MMIIISIPASCEIVQFLMVLVVIFCENANGYNTLTLEEQVPGMYACSTFRKNFCELFRVWHCCIVCMS